MTETICLTTQPIDEIDEDQRLVQAAQQNPAEFRLLYMKWLKPVYRYFYSRVHDVKDAEDLTSQVFLRTYQDLPRYRNLGSFPAWLFTIAHARAVDFYRKGKNELLLEQVDRVNPASDPLSLAIKSEDLIRVNRLITGLSEDDRELIRLRYAANLSYREIGLILNRKEDAVRKSISRLLDRLSEELEEDHD